MITNNTNSASRSKWGAMARSVASAWAGMSLLTLAGCEIKSSDFFAPPAASGTQIHIDDNTPPIFINPFPLPTLSGPFAINSVHIDVSDISGSNGALASGVDLSSVAATINGQSLPVTQSGSTFTASLAGRADGPIGILWSAKDKAGNLGTMQMNLTLDNTPPVIGVPAPPAGTMQSSAPSVLYNLSGTIAEPNLFKAVGAVLKPGPSNTCGNADNSPWPQGTGPGQVSANFWDYTNSVLSNGSFNLNATAYNGVSSGASQTTLRYCLGVSAEDKAMAGDGTPKHNTASRYFTIDQTWMPAATTFALTTSATYRHLGSTSEVCVTINTTPAQTDRAFQVGISGPGVIGPNTVAGTLTSGSMIVRVPINQFGTYSGAVVVGSRSATFSVNVTASPGTCT